MSDLTGITLPSFPTGSFHPEIAMATAQNGLACWSRACTQLANGLMSAGMAQIDLARSIYATEPSEWAHMVAPGNSQDIAHRWLHATKVKYDVAVKGYRRINDTLAANYFTAAESLMDGFGDEAKNGAIAPAGGNAAAAMPPPAAAPAKQKA